MSDLRTTPRVFIRALVDINSSETFLYAITRDLAEGGIFVETDQLLPVGQELAIRFTLPNIDQIFSVNTKVVWTNRAEEKTGMGLQFIDLSESDRQVLTSYIARLQDKIANEES